MDTESRLQQLHDGLPDQPFARATALRDGAPRRGIDALLRSGRLTQPVRGILVKAGTPDDVVSRAAAVCRILPDGAAVCRGTAAWLLGVDARPLGGHRAPPPLECAVPKGRTPIRRPDVSCYATDLTAADVAEVAGVACVVPSRTAIDLARWSTPGIGLGAVDAMARSGLVVPAELLELVERWRGDRFVARARRLIELCDPRAESFGESAMRLRFCDAGFPAPELQISLCDASGRERRRLDMGYRDVRHAWEYDGEAHHRGEALEAADRQRRAEIERDWGWSAVSVTKNLVWGRSMLLEYAIGEVIGMQPAIRSRRW